MFDLCALSDEIDGQPVDVLSVTISGDLPLQRVRKLLFSHQLTIVDLPANVKEEIEKFEKQLRDYDVTLSYASLRQSTVLFSCSAFIDQISSFVSQELAVANCLNKFKQLGLQCRGECWVPDEKAAQMTEIIAQTDEKLFTKSSFSLLKTAKQPPTYFKTNRFTQVFHAIVTNYGQPSYREINPAYFYLYQFAFTYSMMFGDAGHGFINALVGLMLILFEKKFANLNNDMIELVYFGRYLVFQMSIYSIIAGLMYNDFFSLGFDIFGSKYNFEIQQNGSKAIAQFNGVYNFGVDPHWHWCNQSMTFLNSYKMKMSVIIGVTQMLFGLVVKLVNLVKQKKTHTIYTTWIPEFLFMFSFFGYMLFAIVYKMLANWEDGKGGYLNPPSLINLLISVFLSPGTIKNEARLFNDTKLQSNVQLLIFFVAVICIIWLMLGHPVHFMVQRKKARQLRAQNNDLHAHEAEESMADVAVHQVIHTIEYVLGCISHTASYLRLWALSLAHSQLSEVLFKQLLGMSLSFGGVLGGFSLIILYPAWFWASIAILCAMEALSAYLHCLRLSWIEFNSKFFEGEGYEFDPLQVPEVMSIQREVEV